MQALRESVKPEKSSRPRRIVKLGGMGGIGKTQLAVRFAKNFRHCYHSAFWIDAHSAATITQSLRRIAEEAGLDGPPDMTDDRIKRLVLNWFSNPSNTRWLLLYDNHDTPDDFDIRDSFPSADQGHIFITTRRPHSIMGVEVKVQPFPRTSDDAMKLFQGRSGCSDASMNPAARKLVARFDGHPLALATAAAFLKTLKWTYEKYLQYYETNWSIMKQVASSRLLPEYQMQLTGHQSSNAVFAVVHHLQSSLAAQLQCCQTVKAACIF